ncbi:hypothetical protein Misp02_27040 [Microtetraspora sp. NBRC 16547]|nr:hypothetical protein Misp02_27040 [Microtetraspora sp. NBRC 16547]
MPDGPPRAIGRTRDLGGDHDIGDTYDLGDLAMGADHPIARTREFAGAGTW